MSDFFKDVLADMDGTFQGADDPSSGGGYAKVAQGDYQAVVASAELTVAASGNNCLRWKLRILGPTGAGGVIWHNNVLINDKVRLGYVKKDLKNAGLVLASFADLATRVSELEGKVLDIRVYHKNDNVNCWINGLASNQNVGSAGPLGGGDVSRAGQGQAQGFNVDADDVPF